MSDRRKTLDDVAYKCWEVKALKSPVHDEVQAVLERIAREVEPIMRKRRWRVTSLQEFMPRSPNLLGININRSVIKIRVRNKSSPSTIFPYEHLMGTMLHELTHMQVSPHNANFYKLLEELKSEYEEMAIQGVLGTSFSHHGAGMRLGGSRPLGVSQRSAALQAAERRAKNASIMGGGGKRLGGASVTSNMSLRERVAAAALQRSKDNLWCGGHAEDEGSGDDDDVRFIGERTVASDVPSASTGVIGGAGGRVPQGQSSRASSAGAGAGARGGAQSRERSSSTKLATTRVRSEKRDAAAAAAAARALAGAAAEAPASKRPRIAKAGTQSDPDGEIVDLTGESQQHDASQAEWRCSVCTLLNNATFLVCDACGSERR